MVLIVTETAYRCGFAKLTKCPKRQPHPLAPSPTRQRYGHNLPISEDGVYGYFFGCLDRRHQDRFGTLVKEHSHAINAAVSGLSALPGTAQPFAAVRAMTRFLNHADIPFHALIEPAQDAVRTALITSDSPVTLVVHDWCMFGFHTHTGKHDRYQRSHETDLGYELGSALVVDAADGRPLGPMELRLRTANGILSTRIGDVAMPPGHVDELLDAMTAARHWGLGKQLIPVVDREADSVGHYREWQSRGHQFVVRADAQRLVMWQGVERKLSEVVAALSLEFQDVLNAKGEPEIVTIQAGTGRVRVAEADVVLHRAAMHRDAEALIARIGMALDVSRVASGLSLAERRQAAVEADVAGRAHGGVSRIRPRHGAAAVFSRLIRGRAGGKGAQPAPRCAGHSLYGM